MLQGKVIPIYTSCAAAVIVRSVEEAKGSSPNRAIDMLAALANCWAARLLGPVEVTGGRDLRPY